jgi:TonB family protein
MGLNATDVLLVKAIGLSLAGHLVVLGATAAQTVWLLRRPKPAVPLRLIHDGPAKHDEQDRAAQRLEEAKTRTIEAPALNQDAGAEPGEAEGLQDGSPMMSISAAELRATAAASLGELSSGGLAAVSVADGSWSSAADLTNVAAAAQGNPVLLSYFSAIRSQIQQAANRRPWLTEGAKSEGTVSIGFVIGVAGDIQKATVIAERSAAFPELQSAALQIVEASAPFPPLPPSVRSASPTLAVIVPIQFVTGPS